MKVEIFNTFYVHFDAFLKNVLRSSEHTIEKANRTLLTNNLRIILAKRPGVAWVCLLTCHLCDRPSKVRPQRNPTEGSHRLFRLSLCCLCFSLTSRKLSNTESLSCRAGWVVGSAELWDTWGSSWSCGKSGARGAEWGGTKHQRDSPEGRVQSPGGGRSHSPVPSVYFRPFLP